MSPPSLCRARNRQVPTPRPHIGCCGLVYTIPGAISTAGERPPGGRYRPGELAPLLENPEIRDDVVDVLGLRQPAIGHAIALHLGLWVPDIGAQIFFVPGEVGAHHRVRVAE